MDRTAGHRRDLVAVLAWQRAMGVDAAVDDDAVDWLARGPVAPGAGFSMDAGAERAATSVPRPGAVAPVAASPIASPTLSPPSRPPISAPQRPAATVGAATRAFSTAAPDAAQTAARAAATAAPSLEALQAALATFDGCGLKATAKNLCFYRGAARARLLIIGEAPGREEDLEGKPFVGRAGQLLEKMLAAAGIPADEVHITNIVYWRPPGNRTPTPQEAQVCRPFMERQIELVQPEIVMPLGGVAAKHVLDAAEGIMRLRGTWHDFAAGGHKCRAIASLHPAYLLRTPIAKRPAWQDLLAVAEALGLKPGEKG